MAVRPIPEGYRTITPYLVVRDTERAIEFYKRAFAATELFRMPGPDGKGVVHAELKIGDSILMLSDELPQMKRWVSPQQLNGTTVAVHLYVEDVDATYERAVAAGATPSLPLTDAFWGDRHGRLVDPFGHEWSIATHKQDLTAEQIADGAKKFFERLPKGSCGSSQSKE